MGYTFEKLSEGDVRIEAKNDTVITSKSKLRIDAQEVLINGEPIITPPTINLVDNDFIRYTVVLNEETNQLDVHTQVSFDRQFFNIGAPGEGGTEFQNG